MKVSVFLFCLAVCVELCCVALAHSFASVSFNLRGRLLCLYSQCTHCCTIETNTRFIVFHLCLPIDCVCAFFLDGFIFFFFFFFSHHFFFHRCRRYCCCCCYFCLEIKVMLLSFCSLKLLSAYIAHFSYQKATGLHVSIAHYFN